MLSSTAARWSASISSGSWASCRQKKYAKVLEGASEAFLAEQVEYPEGMEPRAKSRFEMLIAPKEHEMHHRAQLMLVERMLGITPHLTRHMEERIAAMQAAQAGR